MPSQKKEIGQGPGQTKIPIKTRKPGRVPDPELWETVLRGEEEELEELEREWGLEERTELDMGPPCPRSFEDEEDDERYDPRVDDIPVDEDEDFPWPRLPGRGSSDFVRIDKKPVILRIDVVDGELEALPVLRSYRFSAGNPEAGRYKKALEAREDLVRRLGVCLCRIQRDFFLSFLDQDKPYDAHLRAIRKVTLEEMANENEIKTDKSTLGRLLKGDPQIDISFGPTIPLREFFGEDHKLYVELFEILRKESGKEIFGDEEIAHELQKTLQRPRGPSRATIRRKREEKGVPDSRERARIYREGGVPWWIEK